MGIITHLPISPKNNPEIGFLNQFQEASFLAKMTNQRFALTANTTGYKNGKRIDSASMTSSLLTWLGVKPDMEWNDSEVDNVLLTRSIVERGVSEGWVSEHQKNVMKCPCGVVEFLCSDENLVERNGRTGYSIENGQPTCLVCNECATSHEEDVLLLSLPELQLPYTNIYPTYARREIDK